MWRAIYWLPTADHIMRLAFGTFLGLPEPTSFMGDTSYVRTRWRADPTVAFGAEVGSERSSPGGLKSTLWLDLVENHFSTRRLFFTEKTPETPLA